MANTIDNSMDIIDSRDVIARIEELESNFETWRELTIKNSDVANGGTGRLDDDDVTVAMWADVDEDGEELQALTALADEASGYASDWQYGETLIRDSYFENYAQELAEDIGAIDSNATWPNNCIDWERATSELQMDYSAVEFDGITYWTR